MFTATSAYSNSAIYLQLIIYYVIDSDAYFMLKIVSHRHSKQVSLKIFLVGYTLDPLDLAAMQLSCLCQLKDHFVNILILD